MKFEDFIQIEIRQNIGICWIDHKFEKMNVVSPAVMQLLDELGPRIQQDARIEAVILISRKPDFMAGADIKSFAIEKEGDFQPFQAKGHQSLLDMEQSKKPFIAAINGVCVGLGTELSLACHGRIATKSPRTKLGLPEVQLGLLPGGGGTQRLPRLIGIQKALDMILTGKQIDVYRAKKWGLVDEITDDGKLLDSAIKMAQKLIQNPIRRNPKLSFSDKILESPIGRSLLFSIATKKAMARSQGNYPAIPAIIDCIRTGYNKGIKEGYTKELYWFEKLMLTTESKALRGLFFAMSENKVNPYGGGKKIDRLGIIGAGFMGAGIAEVSAIRDIHVTLKDLNREVLTAASKQVWKSLSKKVKFKAISKIEAERLLGNVEGHLTYQNFKHVDMVIEAVLEKMSLKKTIIADIEKHCSKDVIIATNTSSLSVTEMARHASNPGQVVGMHYFSPVPKIPLLEIVRTQYTSNHVLASSYALGKKQGKTVIVVRDGPGFYVNRILAPYTNECLHMADEGVAIDKIDKALVKKGFPVGPFTVMDQVGLDIAAHVTESTRSFAEAKPGFTVNDAVVRMFQDGRKGRKNESGFYKYNQKSKKSALDTSVYQYFDGNGNLDMPDSLIQDRALMLMLNEAALCLQEGIISSPTDGDLGAVFGIGFLPFTGGPFAAMDLWGIDVVVTRMRELAGQYGERFKPADLLVKKFDENSRFYEPTS